MKYEPATTEPDMRSLVDDALALHRLATAPAGSLEQLEAERAAMARGMIPFDLKRLYAIDVKLAEARVHAEALRSPFYRLELLSTARARQ